MSSTSSRRPAGPPLRDRARERAVAARDRYEGSWAAELHHQLKDLEFVNWITMFGASLLWSALPLVILLSSLADQRIDDDLSRHIGLNREGAHIVETLFRGRPAHGIEPILTGFIFSFTGMVATVSTMQVVYERVFGHEPLGWRSWPRWCVWTAGSLAILVVDGLVSSPLEHAGPIVHALAGAVIATLFFWWTLHYLLAGRSSWRALLRPAIASGALWVVLAIFSSFYFSPLLVSDSHTYGTIGVVFSLLTWFFLIGGVIVLGAVLGAAWQVHAEAAAAEHTAQDDSPA